MEIAIKGPREDSGLQELILETGKVAKILY